MNSKRPLATKLMDINKKMSKNEAIKALQTGETLTHRFFDGHETIKQDGCCYYQFEDGVRCQIGLFWDDRKGVDGWESDWQIVC